MVSPVSGFQKNSRKIPENFFVQLLVLFIIIKRNILIISFFDFVTETKMETFGNFLELPRIEFLKKKKSVTFFFSSIKKMRALCRESKNSVFFQLYCITNENWTNIFVQFFKSQEKVFWKNPPPRCLLLRKSFSTFTLLFRVVQIWKIYFSRKFFSVTNVFYK